MKELYKDATTKVFKLLAKEPLLQYNTAYLSMYVLLPAALGMPDSVSVLITCLLLCLASTSASSATWKRTLSSSASTKYALSSCISAISR